MFFGSLAAPQGCNSRPEAGEDVVVEVVGVVVELQLPGGPEAEATEAMSLGFIFGCHDAGALLSW